MSLSKVSVVDIVKKQYLYRLKANVWVFNSLILLQLLATLFSLGGTMSTGRSGDGFFLQINYYAADLMIGFTIFWAFIISIQIILNTDNEFTFIVNKSSHHLSDAFFLMTTSIIGGITATLSGFLLKVVSYIFFDTSNVMLTDFVSGPKYFMIGIVATILFICLFSALGYIVGTLVKLNKIFIFLLPILFIGLLFIANKYGDRNFMFMLFDFYFNEAHFWLFMIKAITTSALLFLGAFMISNRSEVRT